MKGIGTSKQYVEHISKITGNRLFCNWQALEDLNPRRIISIPVKPKIPSSLFANSLPEPRVYVLLQALKIPRDTQTSLVVDPECTSPPCLHCVLLPVLSNQYTIPCTMIHPHSGQGKNKKT